MGPEPGRSRQPPAGRLRAAPRAAGRASTRRTRRAACWRAPTRACPSCGVIRQALAAAPPRAPSCFGAARRLPPLRVARRDAPSTWSRSRAATGRDRVVPRLVLGLAGGGWGDTVARAAAQATLARRARPARRVDGARAVPRRRTCCAALPGRAAASARSDGVTRFDASGRPARAAARRARGRGRRSAARCAAATAAGGVARAAAAPGADYAFVARRRRRRCPTRARAWQPRRRARPVARRRPRGLRLDRRRLGSAAPLAARACSTSCTSARSRRAGTFDAAIERLDHLVELGVTHVELMPVAEFSGRARLGLRRRRLCSRRTTPTAARRPEAPRRRLPRARPRRGPRRRLQPPRPGRELPAREFGPYFTDRYRTPWGGAVNFDGPGSDEVRRFFVDNALHVAARLPRRRPAPRRRARPRRPLARSTSSRSSRDEVDALCARARPAAGR